MTTIKATIIADSVLPQSEVRVTTMQLRYPRCIHSEFMTHRVFSRNASSSRAVPVKKLIQDVLDDPYVPLHWGKNQKGMQAHEECNERVRSMSFGGAEGSSWTREEAWLSARDNAVEMAKAFDEAGYHKQLVNRLLEPFSHINVVVTSTEWENFFLLRDHPDAEPHIRMLAQAMKTAMRLHSPRHLYADEWHTPYVLDTIDWGSPRQVAEVIRLSVARCARVSYLTVEGARPEFVKEMALYDQLVGGVPLHASPAEHQVTEAPLDAEFWGAVLQHLGHPDRWADSLSRHPGLGGNLRKPCVQYRKVLEWVTQ